MSHFTRQQGCIGCGQLVLPLSRQIVAPSPGSVPKPETVLMNKVRETVLSLAVVAAFVLVLAAPFRWSLGL